MLKKILLSFVSLLGLGLIGGLALPSRYHVERSTLIRAPSEAVYAHVVDLEHWGEWTPWQSERLPGTEWMFGGNRLGVGAVRSWVHPRLGRGTLSLTQADPKTGVAYDTSMEGGYLMRGRISFAPEGDGTRVTWGEEGSVGGNPLLHYLVPLLRVRLGEHFEQGLARLQTRVESSPPPQATPPEPAPVPVEQAAAPTSPVEAPPPASPVAEAPTEATPTDALPPEPPPSETAPVVAAPAGDGGHTDVPDAGAAPVLTAPGGEPAPAPTAAEVPAVPVEPVPTVGSSAAPASSGAGPAVPPS